MDKRKISKSSRKRKASPKAAPAQPAGEFRIVHITRIRLESERISDNRHRPTRF